MFWSRAARDPVSSLPPSHRPLLLVAVGAVLACGSACQRDEPGERAPATATPPPSIPSSAAQPTAPTARATTPPSARPSGTWATPDGGAVAGRDEVFLGPALPVALASVGALALRLPDQLLVAPFRGSALQPFPKATGKAAASAVALTGESELQAYWTSGGRLVRRSVAADGRVGALEILADDAANGYGVAAARLAGPPARDVVVYVDRQAREQGERSARLWVEQGGSQLLSRDAGGATSVTIAAVGPRRFVVLTLDGRAGMSSVHAVNGVLDPTGHPKLGEDRVVQVLAEAQWHTQLVSTALGGRPVGLIPVAKDITGFGLLSLLLPPSEGEAQASWIDYPNGLNPAPVATARLCGKPYVAFARPQTAKPSSPKLVELAPLQPDGQLGAVQTIASAETVLQVALGAAPGAVPPPSATQGPVADGWLAYATDAGLWAKPVRCR